MTYKAKIIDSSLQEERSEEGCYVVPNVSFLPFRIGSNDFDALSKPCYTEILWVCG